MSRLHRWSCLALVIAAVAGCTSTPAARRGEGVAAQSTTPLPAAPQVAPRTAGLVIEVDTLPDGARTGDWLALRPVEGDAPVAWQHLQLVDASAHLLAPLEPLSASQRSALRDGTAVLVPLDAAGLTPDKRVAHVDEVGAVVHIDRGQLELVDVGDVYVSGDPFVDSDGWSVFEVGLASGGAAIDDERAPIDLRVGDTLPRVGQTLVRVGTTFGTPTPAIALHVDPTLDAEAFARRLRNELERTSLGGLEAALDAPTADTTCATGLALVRAGGPIASPDAAPTLAIALVPGSSSGQVRLGWGVGPADSVVSQTADLVGGCVETTPEGALVVARLAALAASRRWSELHQHAAHLLRTEGAFGPELGAAVSLFESVALFELGHVDASLAILDALADADDAREPRVATASAAALSLHRAERMFELGRLEDAQRHLDAVDVAALDDALEPTRAVLASSVALGRSPRAALDVLAASHKLDHPVLVAWRSLLEAIEAGEGGDVLAIMHEIDGAGGELLAAWPGATAALLEIGAQVALAEGLTVPASALLDEARTRYRAGGLPFRAASALLQLAEVQSVGGQSLAATETAMVAAADLVDAGALREASSVLLGAGARLNRRLAETTDPADVTRALELLGESLRMSRVLATRANDAAIVAESWSQMGEAMLRHFDDPGAAVEAYAASVFYAVRADAPARAARAALGMALALERSGGSGEEVAGHLEAARGYAIEAGDDALLRDIERVID